MFFGETGVLAGTGHSQIQNRPVGDFGHPCVTVSQ